MAVYKGQATPVANQNSLVEDLLEPLAMQVIHQVESVNPLFEVFERDAIDDGAEIQEILIGDANIEDYDADGETTLAPREINAVARYYNQYQHKVITTTIRDNEIRKVAINPDNKYSVVAKLVGSLALTRDDYVYEKEKEVLADMKTAYSGLKAGELVAGTDEQMGKALTLLIKNTIDNFLFKNENFLPYNIDNPSAKIKQRAFFDRIRIVIPYNVKNALDVGFLASVYNLDKTDLLSKIVTIDTTDGIVYVLDKFAVFRYPQIDIIKGQDNAQGDFRNEFLHLNQMLGASTLFNFAWIDASAISEPVNDVVDVLDDINTTLSGMATDVGTIATNSTSVATDVGSMATDMGTIDTNVGAIATSVDSIDDKTPAPQV